MIQRVSVDVVLSLLGDGLKDRIAALRGKATPEKQARVRATDGRCAPVFFTIESSDEPVEGEAPELHLFDGLENIAVTQDIGSDHIFVVTIASGDAGALQSYLVARRRDEASHISEDDDLYMRVSAQYED